MSFDFLVPLGISAIALWLYKRSRDEMAYLSAVIGITSLLISLVLAPWQLQMLLVAVIGLSVSQFRLPTWNQPTSTPEELSQTQSPSENQPEGQDRVGPVQGDATEEKLCYRGRNYHRPVAHVELVEAETPGQYRGAPFKFHQPKSEHSSELG